MPSNVDTSSIPAELPRDAAANRLFSLIGQLSVAWANVELVLDVIVFIVHEKTPLEQERPKSLSRKIRYFKKFNDLVLCSDDKMKLTMAKVAEKLLRHVDARNMIIHGCVVEFGTDHQSATFEKITSRGKRIDFVTRTFDARQIEYEVFSISQVFSLLRNLALSLMKRSRQ
ncbi:MAG: hypothetical protein AAFX81_00290 [Pseudomonadota bacterium]